ncbi:DUF4386 domain-containing protein [Tropicimonas marinistellae]|uniref:DUF4386 domain-containing protein n=1 Tax=Tropicimonas marinistellae TaxID=1739787 RepID=UPI0008340849|nr:DUF4386 domain-containing protein [Tropicimonas marinistellae]
MTHIPDHRLFRIAGVLYLAIILLGLGAELALRAPVLSGQSQDPLAIRIQEGATVLRLSLVADMLMAICDVALAVVLFAILAPYGRLLAGMAMAFRLVQTAIIGANMLGLFGLLALSQADAAGDGGSLGALLEVHGMGYDTGLAFFGVNCLLTGVLLLRHPAFAQWLGALVMLAGLVYLTGTTLRLMSPAAAAAFAPAYLLPIVAETTFCLWLLAGGRRQGRSHAVT